MEIGPVATPACVNIINDLPKTRSGKIMVLRIIKQKLKEALLVISAHLQNAEAVDEIKRIV